VTPWLRALFAGSALALLTASAAPARARAPALAWNSSFSKLHASEYVATGAVGATALGLMFLREDAPAPRLRGGIWLDDAARAAFRARSPAARDAARTASDLTALSAASLLFGVDSLLVPAARGRADVAWQMEWMNLEAFALSTLVRTALVSAAARARPSFADCAEHPSFDPLCEDSKAASLPSGHTTAAFTAAGLSCAHHTHLALYGERSRDGAACGLSLLLAAATGSLRVVGDRHYVSDVVAGAVLGFGVGFGLPLLLHYRPGAGEPARASSLGAGAPASTRSIAWSGTF
jgi:membrane-associated phospholipid phosphatase